MEFPFENLKNKISKLINNGDIFIDTKSTELTIWATANDSELYNIYIKIWKYDSYVTVRNYRIDYSLRGTGIGSKLYDIFEEYIKSLGYKEIKLHLVLTGAEKFWEKKGFIIQNRYGVKKI